MLLQWLLSLLLLLFHSQFVQVGWSVVVVVAVVVVVH
jgi:hypothetical protein